MILSVDGPSRMVNVVLKKTHTANEKHIPRQGAQEVRDLEQNPGYSLKCPSTQYVRLVVPGMTSESGPANWKARKAESENAEAQSDGSLPLRLFGARDFKYWVLGRSG